MLKAKGCRMHNASTGSTFMTVMQTLELIFHHAVRNVRKNHGNAIIGLMLNIAQTMMLVAVFMVIFIFAGMRDSAIRGDTLIYLMSGVFLFMAHIKVINQVASAEGPTSNMMKHRPMNAIVAVGGAALGELYIQVLSVVVILFLYHVIWTPVEIHQPVAAFAMLLAVWFAGLAIGVALYAIRPWIPGVSKLLTMLISRLNMVASGKFFLANTCPRVSSPISSGTRSFTRLTRRGASPSSTTIRSIPRSCIRSISEWAFWYLGCWPNSSPANAPRSVGARGTEGAQVPAISARIARVAASGSAAFQTGRPTTM